MRLHILLQWPGRRGCRLAVRLLALALTARLLGAAVATRAFDVSAGEAVDTLRQVARQGGTEIVFLAETVRDVRTAPVRGEFTLREALDRLVARTPLVVTQDPQTGGLSVERAPAAALSSDSAQPTTPMKPTPTSARTLLGLLATLVAVSDADSQTVEKPKEEEAIVLSPFTVNTQKDTGYLATSTLAGSRLNTSLVDTPASISVMTKDFLDDIAATNVGEALTYALNAEPDRSDNTGNPSASGDLPLSIRGFGGASLGRNYFSWGLETDTYNTERLDFSRGPNSILFGTGGPGGIINTTTKRAIFGRDQEQLGVRIGAWDDYRATLDLSRQFTSKFATRLNLVQQSAKNWRDFVNTDRKGAALAATYRPFRNTEVRFDGEYGEYFRVTANNYLPADAVTPWIAGGRQVSSVFGTVVNGTARSSSRLYVHDPASGTVQSWFGSVTTSNAAAAVAQAGIPKALTDFSVLPLKASIAGDGNRSNSRFNAASVFIEQRIGDLSLEAAANRQESRRLWLSSQNWNDNVVRADPNALLPDGRANPNVGKLYADNFASQQNSKFVTTELRLIAAYNLDLNKVNPWLGSYSVTGLVSERLNKNLTDNLQEVNTTPAGDANYPRSLANANNRIVRRVYLDPFGPGRKGGYDARSYQFNQGGVVSGFARTANTGNRSRETLGSQMVAAQAKLFKDRLVLTAGLRRDAQKLFSGSATADPVTGVFPIQTLNATSTDYTGDTKTFGSVLHVTSWLSGFYNQSDNFVPQSTLTIIGEQLGPRLGKGKDFGLKFRLLEGRLFATVTRYQTSEVNRQNFADGSLINAINTIYIALGDNTRVAGPTSRDGIDTEGKGHELEVTANLTKQWRFTMNFSQTKGTQANNQPRLRSYIATNRVAWATQSARPLIAPISGVPAVDPKTGQPSTIATALDSLDGYIKNILGANGVTRRQLREYTGSVFTAYTFRSDQTWLNDLTLGGGARYRDKPVVGYVNGIEPFFGKGDVIVNLLVAKNLKVMNRRVRLQANLDNILNVNDPIIADADPTGAYRFLYPNPFRWTFSATVTF